MTHRNTHGPPAAAAADHRAALELMIKLREDNGMSERKAARAVVEKYPHENVKALRKHHRHCGGHLVKTNLHQLLTNAQEDALVGVIQGFSIANQPLSEVQIIRMVRKEFKLGDEWRGDDWYNSFISRHRLELHVCHPRHLSLSRTKPGTYEETKVWTARMRDYLGLHTFTAETIFGADETLTRIRIGRNGELFVEAVGKEHHNMKTTKGENCGSIIFFSNAAGHTPLVVILMPVEFGDAKTKEADIFLPPCMSSPSQHIQIMFGFTEKGYMTNEMFALIMEQFRAVIKLRHPDLEHLLYLDRLVSHLQPDVVQACVAEKLYPVWPPAHTSEFLQPADAEQFAAFHKVLNDVRRTYDWVSLLHHRPGYAVAMDFLPQAIKACTQENVVRLSFASTGLFPFDPDLILRHAREFLAPKEVDAQIPAASDTAQLARSLTLDVITAHNTANESKKRKVVASKSHLVTADDLLAEAEQRHEAAEREKKAKEDRRADRGRKKAAREAEQAAKQKKKEEQEEARARKKEEADRRRREAEIWTCKSCGVQCRTRDDPRWLWCDYCPSFGVCGDRKRCRHGLELMAAHEEKERADGRLLRDPAADGARAGAAD